jgi:hypothetical protein
MRSAPPGKQRAFSKARFRDFPIVVTIHIAAPPPAAIQPQSIRESKPDEGRTGRWKRGAPERHRVTAAPSCRTALTATSCAEIFVAASIFASFDF